MKITTLSQAIDLVKNGIIQISCRSGRIEKEVCKLIPEANNDFSIAQSFTHLQLHKNGIEFCGNNRGLSTLTAKRLLALPRGEKPEIQPMTANDCVSGEWYVLKSKYSWLLKFDKVKNNQIYFTKTYDIDNLGYHQDGWITKLENIKSLRPATREEVIKYFPNEFDAPKVEQSMKKATEATNNLASALSDLTPEQLLAKCKEMYPIGTKYYDVIGRFEQIAEKEPEFYMGITSKILVTNLGGLVYHDGKFAEIISLPEQPEQREIIGYEMPMDLFGGAINKGTKGTVNTNNSFGKMYEFDCKISRILIPAELVEAYFTPIYAKTEAETEAELINELINDFINHSNGQSLETFSKSQSKFTITRK